LLVDDLRMRVLADRQIAAVYKANGAEGELPELDEMRKRFDEWLTAPPTMQGSEDTERNELLQALGLRP